VRDQLLADRGRGTLPRRFAASVRAAQWAKDELGVRPRTRWRTQPAKRLALDDGTAITRGSSERQLAPNASVDLVLTDPPYFDDVQYAELAELFLVWARATGLLPDSIELDLASEAVANTARGTGVEEYRQLLTRIFTETRRTLKADGRMILTFHNTDLRAWWALGRALRDADFHVVALAAATAENDRDHPKRGRRGFTKDLVLECRCGRSAGEPAVAIDLEDDQTRELVAAGLVIAHTGTAGLDDFRHAFVQARGSLSAGRIAATDRRSRKTTPR